MGGSGVQIIRKVGDMQMLDTTFAWCAADVVGGTLILAQNSNHDMNSKNTFRVG